jgi:hypothetical protein
MGLCHHFRWVCRVGYTAHWYSVGMPYSIPPPLLKGQCHEIFLTFAPMRGIYLRLKIIYICTLKKNFFLHETNFFTFSEIISFGPCFYSLKRFFFLDFRFSFNITFLFCFWFFSWISFPPAPKEHIRTVLCFLENSRRYSQVKVHHRYQQHRNHNHDGKIGSSPCLLSALFSFRWRLSAPHFL